MIRCCILWMRCMAQIIDIEKIFFHNFGFSWKIAGLRKSAIFFVKKSAKSLAVQKLYVSLQV